MSDRIKLSELKPYARHNCPCAEELWVDLLTVNRQLIGDVLCPHFGDAGQLGACDFYEEREKQAGIIPSPDARGVLHDCFLHASIARQVVETKTFVGFNGREQIIPITRPIRMMVSSSTQFNR